MSVRDIVHEIFNKVAVDQGRHLAPLTDDLPLVNSGLDSLSFAIAVTLLEDKLGRDPFNSADEVGFPVTLGDFIALYEHAGP